MRATLVIAALTFCLIVAEHASALTITRLQYRVSDQDTWSVTESVFHRWDNSFYFLQIYNRDHDIRSDHDNERYEIYLGRPFFVSNKKQPYGWVSRVQKWSSYAPIPSLGMELNFNQLPGFDELLSKAKARSFLQLHGKFRDDQIGNGEILHYYQVNQLLGSQLYVRGYNIYHLGEREKGGDNYQIFADWIYPLHKKFDVYLRSGYLRYESPQLGEQGGSTEIGFRYNL